MLACFRSKGFCSLLCNFLMVQTLQLRLPLFLAAAIVPPIFPDPSSRFPSPQLYDTLESTRLTSIPRYLRLHDWW